MVLHWLGHTPCAIAMDGANEYVNAARTQLDRIEGAIDTAMDVGTRSSVFHEIHYYLICWDAIWKRLNVIKRRSGLASLKLILQRHRHEAEPYVFGRGQLEHYDEWLDGRPKYPALQPWDAGNLAGFVYTLAGRRWDVSRASLERLQRLLQDFADAVMAEGCEKLMIREMNRACSQDVTVGPEHDEASRPAVG